MSALVFLDTETTGLSLDDDIWEIAAVRRDEDGTEAELHLFVEHSRTKCERLPESFRNDHYDRYLNHRAVTRKAACRYLTDLLSDDRGDKPHIVGAVPNFDTERLHHMIRAEWPNWPDRPFWHHHLIDVENLAVGYIWGQAPAPGLTLPWDSNDLSRVIGVEPEDFERHTAMGDARWAMAIYDTVMRQQP